MLAVLNWLLDHPGLVWPILTGVLSFGLPWLEKRFPVLADLMRATGLDAHKLIKLLRVLLGRKGPAK